MNSSKIIMKEQIKGEWVKGRKSEHFFVLFHPFLLQCKRIPFMTLIYLFYPQKCIHHNFFCLPLCFVVFLFLKGWSY